MKLEIIPEAESHREMFVSMIDRRLSQLGADAKVHIKRTEDARVPYNVIMEVCDSKAEALSSNLLTAFTQALTRIESKLKKSQSRRA